MAKGKETEVSIKSKEQGLKSLVSSINKTFGEGSIHKMDDSPITSIAKRPTSSLVLDAALGGGFGEGRIVEVFGAPASGKSTISTLLMAETQRSGGVAAIVDSEHAFDKEYAQKLGVNISKTLISQPDNAEQALNIVDELVSSGIVDVVILDSIAAMVPKAELEGEMGDQQMALLARLMSKAMRKLVGKTNKSGTTLVLINQVRENVGQLYGSPETTSGGKAIKFAASQRLRISRGPDIKEKDNVIGHVLRVNVKKNKIAPPFKKCELNLIYGEGFCQFSEVVNIAHDMDIITRAGAYYSYGEVKLGQGKDAAISLVKDNPELFEELKHKINEQID